jgi:hypothetical protein
LHSKANAHATRPNFERYNFHCQNFSGQPSASKHQKNLHHSTPISKRQKKHTKIPQNNNAHHYLLKPLQQQKSTKRKREKMCNARKTTASLLRLLHCCWEEKMQNIAKKLFSGQA